MSGQLDRIRAGGVQAGHGDGLSGRPLNVHGVRVVVRLAAIVVIAGFACVSSAHVAAPVATARIADYRLPPEAHVEPDVTRTSPPARLATVSEVTPVNSRAVLAGEATYYADKFEGRRTASGVPFRQAEMYAAHRTLPFGTVVRVTNERNGRSVVVRVVDRGPWGSVAKRRNTIIDLSRSAAERLDYIRAGRAPVRIEVLLWGVS